VTAALPQVRADAPLVIGVRHHSPACARLVAATIRAVRPKYVLIEGPADFNSRLSEMALPHRLPVAIYSYLSATHDGQATRRAAWSPFAAHSPEWQALTVGREVGAETRFIDLPAWHDALADAPNRYADAIDEPHRARAAAYEDGLSQALSIDGSDALWDHLFEGELAHDELAERLHAYFVALRGDDPGSPGNQAREAMMAHFIAWAMGRADGPVLVVCGGYHAPALERAWRAFSAGECREAPPVPLPADVTGLDPSSLRYGSYLVPFHFRRLDALAGYASGMSSPAYYQLVWEHGVREAGPHLLRAVLTRLREKKVAASTADFIAVHTSACGLARLRCHPSPLRSDWLDALAGTVCKQALDAPLPWTYRGPVRSGTDPALLQVMDVLAGDARGELAPGTPQPPLIEAVEAELAAHGLTLSGSLALNLLRPAERARSRVLHRLALLNLPGITRVNGPELAMDSGQHEQWDLCQPLEQRAALIEAASYGATLHDAARARLEEILQRIEPGGNRLEAISSALNRAAFAGLSAVSARLLDELGNAVASEPRFNTMGKPLRVLYALYRHGDAVEMNGSALLETVVCAAFDRALWLLEASAAVPPEEQADHLRTFIAIAEQARDALSRGARPHAALPRLEPARALAVCRRKARVTAGTSLTRGAALGLLLSLEDDPDALAEAGELLASLPPPEIGDALAGLLALARHKLTANRSFISAVDALLHGLDDADFVQALPAMRDAFGWLPSRERGDLARTVLDLHHASKRSHHSLTARLGEYPAETLARHQHLERAAIARLAAWGITL
jgi:hypothetical protein